MPTNKISRIDRFAAVKLRQRIQEEIMKAPGATYTSLFCKFMLRRWLPNKAIGEPLEDFGFRRHFNTVKKDLNHSFSGFFICFLSRAAVGAYRDYHRLGTAPKAYNGMREIARDRKSTRLNSSHSSVSRMPSSA